MSDETVGIEIFESALTKHLGMQMDAALYSPPETVDELFVDYGAQVEELNNAAWQIIFGGPGSGKTHLLLTYEERSLLGAIARRPSRILESLPIYLDASSFASRRFLDDDERRAQACFGDFIAVFSTRLEEAVTALQRSEGFYRRLRDRALARRALTILKEIRQELDNAKLRYPFANEEIERESKREDTSERERKGDARFGLSPTGGEASFGLGAGSRRSEHTADSERRTASGSAEPQWHRIRDLIVELCKELQVRRLDILIDNWPSLDGDGSSAVQPHFGELLRKAFRGERGSQAVSVKIAGDGLATRLWDRDASVGLRRNHEIHTVVNLNEALLEDQELIRFFELLLFERLVVCDGRLHYLMDPEVPSEPLSPDFVHVLFGDRETFELLVHGAEGRVRLFLQYIVQMTRATRGRLTEPWSRERVLQVVTGRAALEIAEYSYMTRAVHLLLARIKPAMAAREHPVFSISDAEGAKFRAEIEELTFKELLQPDVPAHYRAQAKDGLLAFSISDDLMREWHRARSIVQELQRMFDGDTSESVVDPPLADLRIYLEGGPPDADGG